VTADASAPVAIEFVVPQGTATVEEYDTLVIGVEVLDQSGDTVPNAPIHLVSLTPDTVGVDSALHYGLLGLMAGPGRVMAVSGDLQSDPLSVSVTAAADSLAAAGATVDTVADSASVSAPLAVALLDFHTSPPDTVSLQGRPVTFAITAPAFDSLGAATVTLGNDSLVATVLTPGSVVVRRQGASQPDSVVVTASATRANGAVVHGSPVRFVVYFP